MTFEERTPAVSGWGAPQVQGFLDACSQVVVSSRVSLASVAVVVFSPESGPWVAWQTSGMAGQAADVLWEMAGALREGTRAWRNGDDPNEVVQDGWARRQARERERVAAFPWWCEVCARRFKSRRSAEDHERTCARRV